MEIEKQKLRDMLLWAFGIVAKLEQELIALQVTLLFVRKSGKFPELDQVLDHARKNPPPTLAKRHELAFDTIRKILEQDSPDQELERFLRDWKPEGPPS